jgi:predicted nucleotidyltransferase
MAPTHYSALEHLSAVERTCVVRYLEILRDRLGSRLVEVHLFGSFARGDAWRHSSPMRSDIDLLVICSHQPSEPEMEDFVNATYPLFLECGRQLSPQFRTRESLESPTTEVGIAFLERFRKEARLVFAA